MTFVSWEGGRGVRLHCAVSLEPVTVSPEPFNETVAHASSNYRPGDEVCHVFCDFSEIHSYDIDLLVRILKSEWMTSFRVQVRTQAVH